MTMKVLAQLWELVLWILSIGVATFATLLSLVIIEVLLFIIFWCLSIAERLASYISDWKEFGFKSATSRVFPKLFRLFGD